MPPSHILSSCFVLANLIITRIGNSTATARDPSRCGTTYGPLDVMADLKEPVSALKARMVQKAMEMSYIVEDSLER